MEDNFHGFLLSLQVEISAAMGNCGSSLDCTLTGAPVQVDPDIAGIGVRRFLVYLIERFLQSLDQ